MPAWLGHFRPSLCLHYSYHGSKALVVQTNRRQVIVPEKCELDLFYCGAVTLLVDIGKGRKHVWPKISVNSTYTQRYIQTYIVQFACRSFESEVQSVFLALAVSFACAITITIGVEVAHEQKCL